MRRRTSCSRGVSWSSSESARRRIAAERVEHEAGQPRREDRVAVGDALDRVGEPLGVDRLGDVAARAGADHGDHVLRRVGDRERQEAHVRAAGDATTATPPPSGMCTSSSTTSGFVGLDQRDGLVDVAGLADDLDAPLELAAHARAEQRVVVDQHDARRPHDVAPSMRSSTSVPPPGCDADLGAAAVALHPADDRLAHAAPVGRHGVGVEPRAAVADEHLGALAGRLGVDVDRARRRRTSPR